MATKNIAYIHGDVAADGTIPSGAAPPYNQMLLTDTGNLGCSQFKAMVEGEGYTISQHYDAATNLDAAFLAGFDVVVFGLHQKVWSSLEKAALDAWIRAGGGILMYSDSAAGGQFSIVGIRNTVGQTAVNNILSQYGMEVTVDQGGGIRSYTSPLDAANPIVSDQPVFEGEGVSPVAVDETTGAQALIPFEEAFKVAGGATAVNFPDNITIQNPRWAAIGHQSVGGGNVIAIFDRQPMWNNGPGSDINEEDNREILRRIVRFLANDYGNSTAWIDFRLESAAPPTIEISYRQWSGGTGARGFDYVARNNRFAVEQQDSLTPGAWRRESILVEELAVAPLGDGESERVTLRLHPDAGATRWFARLAVAPEIPAVLPTVNAGGDLVIDMSGSAWLEAAATGATSQAWAQLSGPGSVAFADPGALQTTATFSQPGTYELEITTSNAAAAASDALTVTVVDGIDVVAAINCGGGAYVGASGFNYTADAFFNGGGIDNFPGNPVAGTGEDALYNTARSKGTFTGYSIPVTNGDYLVYLQFAETFFTADNQRVFDLSLEGALVLDDLDLHATASGKWVAYRRDFATTVSDGTLNLDLSASINNPLMNAFVIIRR